MDFDLWLRLRDMRVHYLPVPLAAFRWHPSSKTAQDVSRNWREKLRIVRRHGGGWTPQLAWSFARANITSARLAVSRALQPAR